MINKYAIFKEIFIKLFQKIVLKIFEYSEFEELERINNLISLNYYKKD